MQLQQWDMSNMPSCPSQWMGAPQTFSSLFLIMQQCCPLLMFSFASFGFSLCPFFPPLTFLFLFFHFFLLYSLLLGSSFLLCHNQTKPDSQEQLLPL